MIFQNRNRNYVFCLSGRIPGSPFSPSLRYSGEYKFIKNIPFSCKLHLCNCCRAQKAKLMIFEIFHIWAVRPFDVPGLWIHLHVFQTPPHVHISNSPTLDWHHIHINSFARSDIKSPRWVSVSGLMCVGVTAG